MKKEMGILMIALAMVMLFSACDGGGGDTPSKVDPFIGGTRGISIQFADGSPPTEVFDNNQWTFDVEVKLKNVGETDIKKENVLVKLSGLNPTDFGKAGTDFIKTGIQEDIVATTKDFEGNTIESPEVYVTFAGLTYKDIISGNLNLPVRADVCYTYGTNVLTDGCIRSNVLSVDKDAVCQVNEEKTVFNSGAPIQITKFQEQASGSDKVRYVFTIEHKGTGRIYLPGTKCPSERSSENKIHFKIESKVSDLTCNGLIGNSGKEGDIILNNGARVVQCVQQTKSDLDYIDTIKVTLTYDYKEFFEQDLLVKKSS